MNAKIMRVARHRMGTDGGGVSTLVAFWGCPMHCRYCLNDFCHDPKISCREMEPEELTRKLMVDEIYFRMSGGGIVFGGGEPLLNAEYIKVVVEQIPDDIPIRVETSLNVPWKEVELLLGLVDDWIIDIKDLNPEIYGRYTGMDNSTVKGNCRKISEYYSMQGFDPKEHILFRVPLIPDFNTEKDVEKSVAALADLGRIDRFEYRVLNTENDRDREN